MRPVRIASRNRASRAGSIGSHCADGRSGNASRPQRTNGPEPYFALSRSHQDKPNSRIQLYRSVERQSQASSGSALRSLVRQSRFLGGENADNFEPVLWRLACISEAWITDAGFNPDPKFSLETFAKRSFGTFQENPFKVVLRFEPWVAGDVKPFVFHPDQSMEENEDGSVSVSFKAGGINEMCRHLFTWGESVTVEKPVRLRKLLTETCTSLAQHHEENSSL